MMNQCQRIYALAAVALGVLAISALPTATAAQDCANECRVCANGGGREGVGYSPTGGYDMTCVPDNLCKICEPSAALARDPLPSESAVVAEVTGSSAEQLASVVGGYRDRLLLHTPRNLLIVRGAACMENYATTVAFVSPSLVAKLRELGVRSYEEFVREAEEGSGVGR